MTLLVGIRGDHQWLDFKMQVIGNSKIDHSFYLAKNSMLIKFV